MNEYLMGYARVSTNEQDLTAQRNALEALGVRSTLIYTDHGLTGTNQARPGLREALAACRNGDTLVVAKLDRLARSLRDAKECRWLKPKAISAANNPNYPQPSNDTLWKSTRLGRIPQPNSPSCSTSPAPPSTGPCKDSQSNTELRTDLSCEFKRASRP